MRVERADYSGLRLQNSSRNDPLDEFVRLVTNPANPSPHVTASDQARELTHRLLVNNIGVNDQNRLRLFGKPSLDPTRGPGSSAWDFAAASGAL